MPKLPIVSREKNGFITYHSEWSKKKWKQYAYFWKHSKHAKQRRIRKLKEEYLKRNPQTEVNYNPDILFGK